MLTMWVLFWLGWMTWIITWTVWVQRTVGVDFTIISVVLDSSGSRLEDIVSFQPKPRSHVGQIEHSPAFHFCVPYAFLPEEQYDCISFIGWRYKHLAKNTLLCVLWGLSLYKNFIIPGSLCSSPENLLFFLYRADRGMCLNRLVLEV